MLKIDLKRHITALCRCFSNVFSLFSAFNLCRFINTPTSSVPCALKSVEWKNWHSNGPVGLFSVLIPDASLHLFSPVRPKTWPTAAPATGPPPGRRRWSSTARQSSWSTASPARSSDRHVPPTAASATTVWVSDKPEAFRFDSRHLSFRPKLFQTFRMMNGPDCWERKFGDLRKRRHKQTHFSLADDAKVRLIRDGYTLNWNVYKESKMYGGALRSCI